VLYLGDSIKFTRAKWVKPQEASCICLMPTWIHVAGSFLRRQWTAQLVRKLFPVNWTQRIAAVFTRVRHSSASWARWIQSKSLYLTY
jgi:hypothetical protein